MQRTDVLERTEILIRNRTGDKYYCHNDSPTRISFFAINAIKLFDTRDCITPRSWPKNNAQAHSDDKQQTNDVSDLVAHDTLMVERATRQRLYLLPHFKRED